MPTTKRRTKAPPTTTESHGALVVRGDAEVTFRCDCLVDFVGRTYEKAEGRWKAHVETMRRRAGERP